MNARFAALSISSTHIRIVMALRLRRTPITPSVNRAAETSRNARGSTSEPPLGQENRSHHGRDQEQRDDLERVEKARVQLAADRLHRSVPGDTGGKPSPVPQEPAGEDREEEQSQNGREHTLHLPGRMSAQLLSEVQQHDDEEDQDHDRPGVDDHLEERDELGVEKEIEARDGHQVEGQGERGHYRVAMGDDHDGGDQRQEREHEEGDENQRGSPMLLDCGEKETNQPRWMYTTGRACHACRQQNGRPVVYIRRGYSLSPD